MIRHGSWLRCFAGVASMALAGCPLGDPIEDGGSPTADGGAVADGGAATDGGTVGEAKLVGSWRIFSSTLYYDAGGSGGSGVSASTRLELKPDGSWKFGTSSGSWSVAAISDADWTRWGVPAYDKVQGRRLVLANWNGSSADGPIEETAAAVDFLWVIYPVDAPSPGTVWLKLGAG